MQSFNEVVTSQAERTKAMYGDMLGTIQRIPGDFEWQGFIKRSVHLLMDPSAPLRSVDSITFANQDHRATQPLIEGTLERKGKILKTYNSSHYVITPSKYLHEFKDTDNFRKDPCPELSLYLPDCTVGAVSGPKFNIRGKDVSGSRVSSALSTNHELALRRTRLKTPSNGIRLLWRPQGSPNLQQSRTVPSLHRQLRPLADR